VKESLLEAAVKHAFGHGASAVEAYAHVSSRGDYMGDAGLYRAHGFESVRETSKRVIVRRSH
jgi:ribosomal protein S18 acetylase RimI-like enzyme